VSAALRREEAEGDPDAPRPGISPEIWRARPYVRWTRVNVEPVREAYSGLSRYQRGYMVRIANQSPGWVITRHEPPGMNLPRIYPEIRPDDKVQTGPPRRHSHAELPPKARQDHVARDKDPDDHRGVPRDDLHDHVPLAKYVFPPSALVDRPWEHEHAAYKRMEKRAKHVDRRHGGTDVPGTHEHKSRVKDRDNSLAKRIDVHRLALSKFATTKTVFFVIEGCIKADAVLTSGAAVFSVPSVTLWDADELPGFITRYLRGHAVIIVPDADWDSKPRVETQARLCQTRLHRLGVTVSQVAAPPADWYDGKRQGIDDYLDDGGNLEDLDVIDRDPSPSLKEYVDDHARRKDQAQRDAEVLYALSMHADFAGNLHAPLRSIARVMGVDVKRVARGLHSLREMGAVTWDGDLATGIRGWVTRDFYSHEFDWEERPTITIAENLRAIKQPPRKLGKVK
jgi:hypothetical protein